MNPPLSRTGADAVIEALAAWGVARVFICPGSTEAAFLDATLDRPGIEAVLTTHESVAVAMADGHARATGEPAVAYLHTHLGLANGLSHLHAARLARSPVVVLTGLKPAPVQAHGGFTTLPDTGALARPFVKSHWQSMTAEALPEDLTRAFRTALTEPAGPAWLGLSQDLMESECAAPVPDPRRYRPRARPAPDPERLDAAAELITGAHRPVLVAGSEVARNGAIPLMTELADRLGAPVFHEDRRGFERPAFPTTHPNFAGFYRVGDERVRDSDLIVFLGCRCFTEFEPPRAPEIPEGARVVHTHTDAAELARVHGVDVDIAGTEPLVLRGLLERLPAGPGRRPPPRVEAGERTAAPLPGGGDYAEVEAVAAVLAELVDETTTVVEDATTSAAPFVRRIAHNADHSWFTSSSGSLGWGMGAALGVRLALPERRVVCVVGDGVFQFGYPALWAAAHHRIPVLFLVVNNQSYAAVASALQRYGGRAAERGKYPGKDIPGLDIAGAAAAFGLPARRIRAADELPAVFKRFSALDGPALIEVMTDPDDFGASLGGTAHRRRNHSHISP